MSDEEVLLQSPLLYRVLRGRDGALSIEVVVGGIVQFEVRVLLNEEESESFAREGRAFADRLAQAIMADPPFGGRSVRSPV
ncbi:hypothetical protein D7Y13_01260 [Corallococcus praedator]|uniref:Uncharacterized protein n=2 Tax=Corallococcus TaxID=83461 RepID=A0A3A8ISL2_9BACT|nr:MULTISPECIES: hypothetical protein [Corallococcus]RKG81291.1 hypothetical protein D7V88_26390 [Corallococcus terminator]RKH21637.1 hypothetical protein D7X74_00830 [Corallococcus sp. CA047B]RKH35480.1 hypothetical protein D7X75_04235 [Corallococcus sp. CA031C]RKI17227.1 hypothetical protein D7Y13_01260 [Corallococcus praedator]